MKIQTSREATGLGAKGGRSALNLGIELTHHYTQRAENIAEGESLRKFK